MKKLMILLFAIAIISLMSCDSQPPKKPFIIKDKSANGDILKMAQDLCNYSYYDANGNTYWFEDKCDKYSIGDTLK